MSTELSLVDKVDALPEGVTKEDLTRAEPAAPLVLGDAHQLLLGGTASNINIATAQAEAAMARLELARGRQEIQARDILDDLNISRKTHQIGIDEQGRFVVVSKPVG